LLITLNFFKEYFFVNNSTLKNNEKILGVENLERAIKNNIKKIKFD